METDKRVRPRVVIAGAGFAGLSCARALASAPVDVTLVDRHNYHLFQPLLYQVATAGLSPGDIAWPVRRLVRGCTNTRVLLDEITGVDVAAREVLTNGGRLPYDYLVLATGVRHAYFGHDDWEPYAPGLKTIDDALEIRRRVLLAFERAESTDDEDERRRLLTFVIVGAGPTGVEMAGALAELARKALAADFRRIDARTTRVVLVEAGPRPLPGFPESLSAFTRRALTRLGVEVRTGKAITACDARGVGIGEERLESATVVWAAGVAASPVARWLDVPADRAGRIAVQPDFSVAGRPRVLVVGDAAFLRDAAGRVVPGLAPAAKQAGRYAGGVIAARVSGSAQPAPFRYRDWGSLATVGRRAAVIDFGRLRMKGRLAWWLWGIAHIYFLISLRNRLLVATQWLWSYVTFERGARLITGRGG